MTREIPLTRGLVALVDDEDWDIVAPYKWCAARGKWTWYAYTSMPKGGGGMLMHRMLMPQLSGPIDHVNGVGTHNYRSNIRAATITENNANSRKRQGTSSRYKGVRLTASGTWQARIKVAGREKYLSTFVIEQDAARAYDKAARELFGEFAALNFPEPGERSALD